MENLKPFAVISELKLFKRNLFEKDDEKIRVAINEIVRRSSGMELFYKLRTLVPQDVNIVFLSDDYETRFEPGNFDFQKELLILCHTENIGQYEAVGSQKYKVLAIDKKPEVMFIGGIDIELDEILFHEFLHMKHFLEEKAPNRAETFKNNPKVRDFASIRYSDAMRISYSDISASELPFFPELLKKREAPLWYSFEERRVIFGPDKDGITENLYRNEKNGR